MYVDTWTRARHVRPRATSANRERDDVQEGGGSGRNKAYIVHDFIETGRLAKTVFVTRRIGLLEPHWISTMVPNYAY